jgi:hypothetical protein
MGEGTASTPHIPLVKCNQQQNARRKHSDRNPKLYVRNDSLHLCSPSCATNLARIRKRFRNAASIIRILQDESQESRRISS